MCPADRHRDSAWDGGVLSGLDYCSSAIEVSNMEVKSLCPPSCTAENLSAIFALIIPAYDIVCASILAVGPQGWSTVQHLCIIMSAVITPVALHVYIIEL